MAGSNGAARVRRERHDGWTANCRLVFIEALKLSACVTSAAKAADRSRASAYRLRDRDAAFREAWDDAIEQTMDDLFALLLDRAKNGSTRTITEDGKAPRTIHSYSDGMALALLKLYRPELHRKVREVRVKPRSGPDLYERIAGRMGWPTKPPE